MGALQIADCKMDNYPPSCFVVDYVHYVSVSPPVYAVKQMEEW